MIKNFIEKDNAKWKKDQYLFYIKIENLLNKIYKIEETKSEEFLINNGLNPKSKKDFIKKSLIELETLKKENLEILKKSLIKYRELDKYKERGVFLYTNQNFKCKETVKNMKYGLDMEIMNYFVNKNIFVKKSLNITTLNLDNMYIELHNKSNILKFRNAAHFYVQIFVNLKELNINRKNLNEIIKIFTLIEKEKIYKKNFIILFLKHLTRFLDNQKYASYNGNEIKMLLELYLKNKICLEYFLYLYFLNIYIQELIFTRNKDKNTIFIYKWNVIVPFEFYKILDKFNFVFNFINLIPGYSCINNTTHYIYGK